MVFMIGILIEDTCTQEGDTTYMMKSVCSSSLLLPFQMKLRVVGLTWWRERWLFKKRTKNTKFLYRGWRGRDKGRGKRRRQGEEGISHHHFAGQSYASAYQSVHLQCFNKLFSFHKISNGLSNYFVF